MFMAFFHGLVLVLESEKKIPLLLAGVSITASSRMVVKEVEEKGGSLLKYYISVRLAKENFIRNGESSFMPYPKIERGRRPLRPAECSRWI
jgi:hypothetical protein